MNGCMNMFKYFILYLMFITRSTKYTSKGRQLFSLRILICIYTSFEVFVQKRDLTEEQLNMRSVMNIRGLSDCHRF